MRRLSFADDGKHSIDPRFAAREGGAVDNPQQPGRTYVMGSTLVGVIVLAAFIFALVVGIHSFG